MRGVQWGRWDSPAVCKDPTAWTRTQLPAMLLRVSHSYVICGFFISWQTYHFSGEKKFCQKYVMHVNKSYVSS